MPSMRYLTCTTIFLLLAVAARAEPVELDIPAGPGSLAPAVVSLDRDRAVLTWLEQQGDGHAFKFARFDGERFGPARVIASGDDWFANWADTPGLFVLPNGDWLAHWLVKSGPGTFAYDIVMARSSDEGETWSETFKPHFDGTETEHGFVSYFEHGNESAGVVWLDGRETASGNDDEPAGAHAHQGNMTLRTATVEGDNSISESQLLDERACDCCQTASAVTPGGPLVVYRDRSDDEIRDIRVIRHGDEGWSEPRELHRDGWRIGGCPVNGPDLIARGEDAVAAWFTMPEGVPRVRVSVSRNAGETFSAPLELGEGTALGRVALTWIDQGFVLAWMAEDESGASLLLTAFTLEGERLWQQEVTSLSAGRISGFARMATLASNRLLLAWTEPGAERKPRVHAAILDLSP